MTNDKYQMTNKYDIHQRIFSFVIHVIKFLNKLPKTQTNIIFVGQGVRSVSSVGANDQEADGTLTTKDFLHCYTIVRKEGKETIFWLRVVGEVNESFRKEANELIAEGNQIVAIVSTIMRKTAISKNIS